GHAAVYLAVLPHATTERHALQIAFQCVVPLVVRTGEAFHVAAALAHELHAPVRTDVLKHMDLAVLAAAHHHRTLANDGPFEIALIRHFGFQPHIAPMVAIKEGLQFFLVQVRPRICFKRNAAAVFTWPSQRLGMNALFHGLSPDRDRLSIGSPPSYAYRID